MVSLSHAALAMLLAGCGLTRSASTEQAPPPAAPTPNQAEEPRRYEDSPDAEHFPAEFVQWVREGNVEALAQHVHYPLVRPFPLSRVWGPQDFVARYDELLEPAFRQRLGASTPTDWESFGWRGRSFEGVWVSEDEPVLRRLTRMSRAEEAAQQALHDQLHSIVHASLNDFVRPRVYLETPTHKHWIDEAQGGELRYAAWTRDLSLSDPPTVFLKGGSYDTMGTMRLDVYAFTEADATLKVFPSGHPKTGLPYIERHREGMPSTDEMAQWVDLAPLVQDPGPGPLSFTPTGRESLTSVTEADGDSDEARVRALLAPHRFVLLRHDAFDSLEGDDEPAYGEHPGVRDTFLIGGPNTVEAFWLFASFERASWMRTPDDEAVQWEDAPPELGFKNHEWARMEHPKVGEWETLWEYTFTTIRDKDTKAIQSFQVLSRGEGFGAEVSMRRIDGYTWELRSESFAD